MHSLNKLDELSANTKYLNKYRECSLMCFNETWFKDCHTNIETYIIDGFICKRMDRTPQSQGNL